MRQVIETARNNNIELTGDVKICEECVLCKIKKNRMNKEDQHASKITGERLFIDISYVNKLSLGKNKYWLLVVDQKSRHKWCRFMATRNESNENVTDVISELKSNGLSPKFIRCDNSGENQHLEQYMTSQGHTGIRIEYTSPHTPQQNGIVEKGFESLYNLMRTMVKYGYFAYSIKKPLTEHFGEASP